MTCQFFLTLAPDMRAYLRRKLRGFSVHTSVHPISLDALLPETEVLGVFVDSKITKDVLKKLPNLKIILTLSTGFDHIDLKACKKRGVTVCSVPAYGERTVAEFALGLILSLSRKIVDGANGVRRGIRDNKIFRGFDLQGKTVGVIGAGKIGRNLIQLLQPFNVTVFAYDAYPNKTFEAEYGFQYVPLKKLLKEADIISLHAPLLPETRHMIDKKAMQKMKPGVMIVNTARGGLIDSPALLWGLEQGIIAGFATDVLEKETLVDANTALLAKNIDKEALRLSLVNQLLIDHPHTIITPHIAFNSHEAIQRIIDTSVDNLKGFLAGEPRCVVEC